MLSGVLSLGGLDDLLLVREKTGYPKDEQEAKRKEVRVNGLTEF